MKLPILVWRVVESFFKAAVKMIGILKPALKTNLVDIQVSVLKQGS
jgi:hypothetical protein